MLVSLVFIFGLVQFFDATQRNKNMQFSKSQIQERGRVAAELMAQDIRMMDFWGCINNMSQINLVLDQTHTNVNFKHLILDGGSPLRATDSANNAEIAGVNVVNGSDTISILSGRSLQPAPQIVAPIMNNLNDPIQISVGTPISQGDSIIISDCQNADLFTNTHSNTINDGILKHETGSLPSGIENTTGLLSALYDTTASLLSVSDITYFIGVVDDASSLYRVVNGRRYELVRGVTDLQLTYGIDDDQDGSIDRYSDGNSADLQSAIVVRGELTIQSDTRGFSRPFIFVAGIRNRNLL